MKNTNKITNKTALIGSLILILTLMLITACSSSDSEPSTSEQTITNQNQNPVKITNQYDQITENTEIQPSSQAAEETLETPIYTKEVAELIEKSADITSFSYLYTSSVRDEYGNYDPEDDYEAQVKKNKIKKIYPEAKKLNSSTFYSEVYLDTEQETAYVTCDFNSVICKDDKQKIYFIRYQAAKIDILPLEIIKNIPSSAAIVGTATINDRKATVLEYINSAGNKDKLSLDNYSGFPLKQESFILEDDEELLLQRSAFNLKSFNDIKNADVNVPDNYVFG